MSDDVLCLLEAARMLISDPENWTTAIYAKNKRGERVIASDGAACKWCALGALFAFRETEGRGIVYDATLQLGESYSVAQINDTQGHAAVLALYDRAIEQRIANA